MAAASQMVAVFDDQLLQLACSFGHASFLPSGISQLLALAGCRSAALARMLAFLQDMFVTMFDGSPEKALRAVLTVMGVYVLTAAPLVTWVVYGLFQRDAKVSCGYSCCSQCLRLALCYLKAYSKVP